MSVLDLGPDLVGMMIVPDRDHLEVEAMAEVIERTAMMMEGMRGPINEETGMRDARENIILWYVLMSALNLSPSGVFYFSYFDNFLSMILFFAGPICNYCCEGSFTEDY